MPQALECIEYRAASAKGTVRRKRGKLNARLVDLDGSAGIEVHAADSRRPHHIPVSRLVALTVRGQRHPIDADPADIAARVVRVRQLLADPVMHGRPAFVTPAKAPSAMGTGVPAVLAQPAASAHPQNPPVARQTVITRGGTSAALVPERAYGCLLLAMGAICVLEVLVLVLIKLR